MAIIEFDETVDESREVKFKLPANFPTGKIRIIVESTANEHEQPTPLTFRGLTMGEIMQSSEISTWADLDIDDSQAWADDVRQRIQERRDWSTDS